MCDELIDLGGAIRLLRRSSGLTQKQLAGELGLDASTVSRYEAGELEPSETVVRLMLFQFMALGCSEMREYKALARHYGLNPKSPGATARPASVDDPQASWIQGVSLKEQKILRDYWLARRLGDPELVDEIERQIHAIKRISRKRGVWSDEKGSKSA